MDSANETLGPEPTKLLLDEAEAGHRHLAASEVERLDRTALLDFFSSRGIPPGPWPEWVEIRPTLKAELWMRILESAKKGWAALATSAADDLAPVLALDVARAGIETARARGGSPLDWQDLASRPTHSELRPLLTLWARENVLRMRGDWENAYIVLGDDPGGVALAGANVLGPISGRLVTRMCEALNGPNGETARAWLDALATSPLRDVVPLEIKLELAPVAGETWSALARLRQAYEGTLPSAEAAPPEQHPFLERELKILAQGAPAGIPDLAALSAQLGGQLSESTQEALSKWIKPARPQGAAAGTAWLTGIAAVAREQTGKLADLGARAREETGKLKWPNLKVKTPRPKLEPKVEPTPTPSSAAVPTDAEPTEVQKNLLEWIRGGSAEDDRRADDEMIRLFENGIEKDLLEARQAIEGFGEGILYRLAARAALNPRVLDGLARAVHESTLDIILLDIVHYDLWGFAPQAAKRLHGSAPDGLQGPIEQAVIRLLRDGPPQAREALAQHLGAIDRALLEELLGPHRKTG